MVDNQGPKRFEHARRQFWERVERRAGSRREIVKAADRDGYRVSEQSVGGWVRGENEPHFAVFLWASDRWEVSIDELRLGRPFQEDVAEQLADLTRRQERLEGRLTGWEIEWAAAAGKEPPESLDEGGPIRLAERAFRQRVEALEREVRELRRQQQA